MTASAQLTLFAPGACSGSRRFLYADWLAGRTEARLIDKLLCTFVIDDVMVFNSNWRLKYQHLESGNPHYQLTYRGRMVGIVDMVSAKNYTAMRQMLAGVLVACGCREKNCRFIRGGARYVCRKKPVGLPRLFELARTG